MTWEEATTALVLGQGFTIVFLAIYVVHLRIELRKTLSILKDREKRPNVPDYF